MSITATLWEHKNFGGKSFTSNSVNFRYWWNTWGANNDIFSSMRAWSTGHRGNAYAFEHIDFSGRFAALNVGGKHSSCWWSYFGNSFNDKVSSSLIVAREPSERETELTLRALAAPQFMSLFDAKTAGKPIRRNGDASVYATFFPSYDRNRVFATIKQSLTVRVRVPLKFTIPNPFGDDWEVDLGTFRWYDYDAQVKYDIEFFVSDDGIVHGKARWSHVWVEAGVFSKNVHGAVAPELHAAKADITSAIEGALALFGRRRFREAYLLPGATPDMDQFGFFGNHDDDVVLVLVGR